VEGGEGGVHIAGPVLQEGPEALGVPADRLERGRHLRGPPLLAVVVEGLRGYRAGSCSVSGFDFVANLNTSSLEASCCR